MSATETEETDPEREYAEITGSLTAAVESLSLAAEVLGGRTDIEGWDELALEDLAPLLRGVAVARKRLLDVENGIAEAANRLMDKRNMVVAGVALEKGGPSGSDKWDWDSLVPDLVARAADERNIDRETGEALESEVNAVVRVLRDVVSFQYARVGKVEEGTGLRGRGLDPDDYRTKPNGPGRAKVILK